MKGVIFDIKRLALHDGPGIRQTVFLKGCPLSCHWCHNPESRSKRIICTKVIEVISRVSVEDIETIGREISVVDLMTSILRDRILYEESGGGVTFSGGEPLMQPGFLLQMLQQCHNQDIHTCVDTSGYASWKTLKKIAPFTDLFLYDLKHPDNDKHLFYTGVGNAKILKNLYLLDSINKDIWIRIPYIPTINDDEADLLKFLGILAKLNNKPQISLLPYHKLGSHKYAHFQMPYHTMQDIEEPVKDSMVTAKQLFENEGYYVTIGG